MAHFIKDQRYTKLVVVPPFIRTTYTTEDAMPVPKRAVVAVDTEGTVDDPICVTWSDGKNRYYVEPDYTEAWWKSCVQQEAIFLFHNAPWDWGVLESLGISEPSKQPFLDTMEFAYLRQTEPQGLKDLAYRYFLHPMKSWEDVVMPHYNEVVLSAGQARVDMGTTTTTHTKTGKLRKKPIVKYTEEAKPFKRALGNAELMAKRLGPDFPKPSLWFAPFDEMVDYATLDPYMTYKVWEAMGKNE